MGKTFRRKESPDSRKARFKNEPTFDIPEEERRRSKAVKTYQRRSDKGADFTETPFGGRN